MRKTLLIIPILMAFISCKKEAEPVVDLGYDYFPTIEGLFQIYDVMEAVHDDPSGIHDTTVYQLKTLIGEKILDNEGDSVNKFFRFTRNDNTEDWLLKDVWTIKRDEFRGEWVDENNRVIKFIFPPNVGSSWNQNALNIEDSLMAEIEFVNGTYLIGPSTFLNSAKVHFENDTNLVNQFLKYEIYTKGIGLVQRHWQDYEKIFLSDVPRIGNEHHYVLRQWGIE